jgi:hypothetical protein
MAVFWTVAPCSLVEVYQRFRGPCCLQHQGDEATQSSDDGGSKDLQNVGKLLPDYTALQPRRQPSSYSPPWEPQILISVSVYWEDVGVPGWKLSGWSNTRATISSKNCEKYSRSTLGMARYLRSYWDRRADAGYCVLLSAPAQERPRMSEGPAPRCTNIITIFPRICKAAMRKHANKEGLL